MSEKIKKWSETTIGAPGSRYGKQGLFEEALRYKSMFHSRNGIEITDEIFIQYLNENECEEFLKMSRDEKDKQIMRLEFVFAGSLGIINELDKMVEDKENKDG